VTVSASGHTEQTRLRILEMIVRAEPLADIMHEIVRAIATDPAVTGAAILLLRDQHIEVVAVSGLPGDAVKYLEAVPVARLLDEIMSAGEPLTIRPLLSGAGEVLGALAIPARAARQDGIEPLEGLAGFAIERDHLLAELTWRAEHDTLTHLRNRQWFEGRLAEMAFDARRTGSPFAVICLNIDRFRLVNDVLGHRVGNRLLREIAMRLKRHLGGGEEIARAAGNEFLVLSPSVEGPASARAAGERLLGCLKEPFLVEDHELFVSASVGVTFVCGGDVTADEIESRAYAAMACARARGRNQVALFDGAMLRNSRERLEIGNRLRQALANSELELHYQPQVLVNTGEFIGVEALLRWKHAAIGFVSPGSFIPVAEESGLIASFGEWAIAQTLRQCAAWRREGLGPMRVAVNISPAHFAQEDFAARFRSLFERAEPGSVILELELTESLLVENLDRARELMQDLAQSGVGFAIDDFGTGHSSLAYLQKLPIQRLKIAQTFIGEISSADERPALAANMIRLASNLGVCCIAEGVETPEQANALKAMKCSEAQGYLYSKPLTGAELSQWLRSGANTKKIAEPAG
jgi:diguanylate cyclase (GGDEF)-like protein